MGQYHEIQLNEITSQKKSKLRGSTFSDHCKLRNIFTNDKTSIDTEKLTDNVFMMKYEKK